MTLPSFYTTGTVSVTNGATTVTGSATGWGGDVILAGDLFMDPAQPEIPPQRIAEVTDGTHLELAVGWPGTTMSADAYEVRFIGIIERSTAQSRRLLEQMSVVTANGRGLFYRFSDTTTDADPGPGYLRFNHATVASATAGYVDNLDANGATVSSVLDTWDDGTSTVRGQLWLRKITDPSVFHAFNVTGSVVDGTGYRKLTLAYVGGSGAFAADDELMVFFAPKGDAATDGIDGKFSGAEVIKTAAYTALAADVGKTIVLNKATADTLSFDDAATLGSTWMVMVKNIGAGTWSLDPDGSETIDGAATLPLAQNQSVIVSSNGTALRTILGTSYKRPETGAISRPLSSAAVERISALDFLANDGSDNSSAMSNFVAAIEGKEVYFPAGTYDWDQLQYNPTTDRPVRIIGAGPGITTLRKEASGAGNLITLGSSPSLLVKRYIHLEGLTLDGLDKVAFAGIEALDTWSISLKNIQSKRFQYGFEFLTNIFLEAEGLVAENCDRGLNVSYWSGESFASSQPNVLAFRGCLFQNNSKAGATVDDGAVVTFDNSTIEYNGTTLATSDEGGLLVGANMARFFSSAFGVGVVVRNCWFEGNKGIAQIELKSGYNIVKDSQFFVPSSYSTHDIRVVGGRYVIEDCVTETNIAGGNIKEESGAGSGNRIVGGRMRTISIDNNKTMTDGESALSTMRRKFMTVGGSDVTAPSFVLQNSSTFWQINPETGDLVVYNGSTEVARFDATGKFLSKAGAIGYNTGAGGAVTQATNRTTGVTINKAAGAITLVSAAGTTSWQSFTVTNSTVAATDTVIVTQKSGTDLYEIHVTAVAAGSFRISYRVTSGTTVEQPVFNFAVIKAVAA